MNEKDYIELQDLLTRLRVMYLRIYGNKENKTKEKERALKMVRRIDYLRSHIEIEEENI